MVDEFGGGLSADCPKEFVLHLFVEGDSHFVRRVVVYAGGVDVLDLLVKETLREAYLAYSVEKLLEVVVRRAGLQAFVVQSKAFDEVFAQSLCRPDAEMRALLGLYTVAYGDYYVEVVVVHLVCFSVTGSCCKICNN